MCKYTLGENIRRWRQFRGFQQAAFAEELDISSATLSKYENGRTEMPVTMLAAIAGKLEVSMQELMGSEGNAVEAA